MHPNTRRSLALRLRLSEEWRNSGRNCEREMQRAQFTKTAIERTGFASRASGRQVRMIPAVPAEATKGAGLGGFRQR
jgi:hypothetical protein